MSHGHRDYGVAIAFSTRQCPIRNYLLATQGDITPHIFNHDCPSMHENIWKLNKVMMLDSVPPLHSLKQAEPPPRTTSTAALSIYRIARSRVHAADK